MAERPSVEEILARVRAAGPAKPAEEATPKVPAEEPTSESMPEEPTDTEPDVPTTEPQPTSPPSSEPPRRPLTLQEKLAAARGRPAGAEPASPPSPPASTEPIADEPAPEDVAESATPSTPASPEAPRRPLTLKEKLAAARAGSGGAVTTPTAKPPEAETTMEATARPLPRLEEMTDPKDLAEAARRAGAEKERRARAAAAEARSKARPKSKRIESRVVPPRPERPEIEPSAEAEPSPEIEPRPEGIVLGLVHTTRRHLMRTGFWIAAGWSTFAAGLAAFVAMSLRYMFPNILAEPPSTIKVGLPSNFESGEVNETWKGEWGFWIVRSDNYDGEEKIYALSTICTHLGCPPNWLPSEQKFKCPCHGSGFYISGVNFEGPAPRPLERYKVSIGDDGQIVVDKSVKFQEELHQWSDPESFINA